MDEEYPELVKMIVCDFDGTLYDREHPDMRPIHCVIRKAKEKAINFVVVTGRGDTLPQSIRDKVWLIGSNGCEISHCDFVLSSNPLTFKEINTILSVYFSLGITPDKKGVDFFKSSVYIEQTKVSVVLGKNQKKDVEKLRSLLPKLNVGWGALPFADITHKTNKKRALEFIRKGQYLNENQMVVIADEGENNKELFTYPRSYMVKSVKETYAIINRILREN